MGAYLSQPETGRESSDGRAGRVKYGASSMQGWRVSQEDAHNAILNYDKDTHLFAVYDGHGGHEVSAYTAMELPQVIKGTEAYGKGNLSQALTDAFLQFDETLVRPEIVAVLTHIASTKENAEDSDNSEENVDDLYREATMPLSEVMAQYGGNPQLARCKDKKVSSPFLKAKITGRNSSNEDKEEEEEEEKEEEEEEEDKDKIEACSSSSSLPSSSMNGTKKKEEKEEEEEEEDKACSSSSVNGTKTTKKEEKEEEEEEDKACSSSSSSSVNGTKTKTTKKEEKKEKEEEEEKHSEEKPEINGEEHVNGETANGEIKAEGEAQPRKGKSKGGGKGKTLVRNSELRAVRERRAEERKREAAVKAAEIYKKMQKGEQGEEEEEEEEDDEEEDENFEDGGDEDAEDIEDSEEEEEEEEEDDDDEDEEEEEEEGETEDEEDDQYTQFALNMKEEPGFDSGCTACVAVIRGQELFVANVGDSRCVVCRDGRAVEMSLDHKPEDQPESERIRKAGGRVTADGRVNGGLNLSRAIGDHGYKQTKTLPPEEQMISPLPDVRSMPLRSKDKFMIVACDGIWNSVTSQEACDFVSGRLNTLGETENLSTICEELFDLCLAPDTHGDGTGCDNMTCIIVTLSDLPSIATSKRSLQEDDEEEEEEKEKKEEEEEEGPRHEEKKLKTGD